jgi:hypothetical protein
MRPRRSPMRYARRAEKCRTSVGPRHDSAVPGWDAPQCFPPRLKRCASVCSPATRLARSTAVAPSETSLVVQPRGSAAVWPSMTRLRQLADRNRREPKPMRSMSVRPQRGAAQGAPWSSLAAGQLGSPQSQRARKLDPRCPLPAPPRKMTARDQRHYQGRPT